MSGNVKTLKNGYNAFAEGDIPAVLEAFDPKIEWTVAKGFPYEGTYVGHDAVVDGVFRKLGTEWDGYNVNPIEFIDAGATVVVLGKYGGTYKATGKSFETDFAHVWRFRGNKAVKFSQFTDSAAVNKALQA